MRGITTNVAPEKCKYYAKFNHNINIKEISCRMAVARFRVQYEKYFPSLSYFADLVNEPLGG